ncbi:MAG: hypothetical protein ACU837_03920 [Gammaproteobacteria bacterium]
MAELWVVNASPLIVLGKAGQLELLVQLAETLVVPMAVYRETTVRKEETSLLAFFEKGDSLRIENDTDLTPDVLAWDLGSGESQAISQGLRLKAKRVFLTIWRHAAVQTH